MPKAVLLTEQQIRYAMSRTQSNRGAARFLNVSFPTYRLYSKLYRDEKSGLTLFDLHKNKAGKGIPKFNSLSKEPHLHKLLQEGMSIESYNINKLKHRLLVEGYLSNECCKCGFNEKRVIDFKVPLLLNFKSGIKSDWRLENLELLCYNCYYLHVGDIFTSREQRLLEDFGAAKHKTVPVDWDLDRDVLDRINQYTADPDRDGSEFISRY
jgi:hypothetical protein